MPGGSGAAASSSSAQDEVADLIEVDFTTSQRGALHAVFNGFR